MAGKVADCLGGNPHRKPAAGSPGPSCHGGGKVLQPGGTAVDKARALGVQDVPFDQVTGGVAKGADVFVQLRQRAFVGQAGAAACGRRPGGPWLAVNELFPFAVPLVKRRADALQERDVQQAHQVEPETVHVVFFRPVEHRFKNVPCGHAAFRSNIVAAGRTVRRAAVRVLAVKIPGLRTPQPGIQGIGVVVYHIHNNTKSVFVQRLHGFLEFPDAHGPVVGVGGIAAVGDVVVDRVIAPVVRFAALGHRTEVKHRHQLHMGHPEPFEIVEPGRVYAIMKKGGAGQGQRLVGAAQRFGNPARSIVGEIPHMQFIDDVLRRVGGGCVGSPVFGVGAAQIQHHAARPVPPAGAGPGVGGAAGGALGVGDGEIIIGPVQVAGHRALPPAVRGAVKRLDQPGFAGCAVVIQIQGDGPGGRRPEREGGGVGGIGEAERAVVMEGAGKGFGIIQPLAAGFSAHRARHRGGVWHG